MTNTTDQVCQWVESNAGPFHHVECNGIITGILCFANSDGFRYCPYCRKPISEVEGAEPIQQEEGGD